MKIRIALRREGPGTVPASALILSLLSLAVPVIASAFFPAWTNEDVGILVWMLALVPAFLLSYHHGWAGASIALAAGMAAFTVAQLVVNVTGATPPRAEVMLGVIVVLIAVALGSGWIATLFGRALRHAEEMALSDSGTGLPNRRHALLHLNPAFAAAERGSRLALVLFDLDHFKSVNDRFGHRMGDDVLRAFAAVLRAHTRAMHLSARWGGEEFVLILNGTDVGGATIAGERIRQAIRTLQLPCGRVTVSVGVAEYEPGMAAPDVLIAAADQALYRAKRSGRDRVVTLQPQGRSAESLIQPVMPELEAGPASPGAGELVLIVDDDVSVLSMVAKGLRRVGYDVLEASSPTRALELAAANPHIDVVVADVVMPEMSGFRLVEILLERRPVRALYISGYSEHDVDWSGVPGTVRAFLPKPFSVAGLAAALRQVLDAQVRTPGPAQIVAASAATGIGLD